MPSQACAWGFAPSRPSAWRKARAASAKRSSTGSHARRRERPAKLSRSKSFERMHAMKKSTNLTKTGLAEMLKGGVIMDVVDSEQARIAEDAGACAVMALERVPAQIRAEGGVARASDPAMIRAIQRTVSIPVMAKCRIGHFIEA